MQGFKLRLRYDIWDVYIRYGEWRSDRTAPMGTNGTMWDNVLYRINKKSKLNYTNMKRESKEITVEVSGDEDETFNVSYEYRPFWYRPFCVWLHCSKRELPMPIGNLIYPYKTATIVGRDGKLLKLKLE